MRRITTAFFNALFLPNALLSIPWRYYTSKSPYIDAMARWWWMLMMTGYVILRQ